MSEPTPDTAPAKAPSSAPRGEKLTAVEPGARYVLDREIAAGGMGRVFQGRDLFLGRTVAIKTARDASAGQRFEQEVRLAARLQHPGIVTVYDAGFWPTGEPFLVMKLVLGRSLDRVIASAETLEDRLALLPQLTAAADALAYAHDQGVIHRDLKPSNIIVGAFGETVLVDWGLAKDLAASDEAQGQGPPGRGVGPLTQNGAVMGTPAYMAPEQAAGEIVDARADVYALGAVLCQTLTGQAPELPVATASASAALTRLEPRLPTDLAAILDKAMAANKSDRYPSAFELAEDLKRFQAGQLVGAQHYSALAHVGRMLRRHPWLIAILVAATALLGLRGWLTR